MLTIMMMVVGGVFGGFNVRAEPRIWGAPHHQAGRERAGDGARLSRGKAGENILMFDLLDICDEQTWGLSVHII